VVSLDVLQGFNVPAGGQLKGAVDFIQTCNQVLIHGASTASNQAVGDHTEVVADVTRALSLTTLISSVVGALHLGGVREFVVNGLSSAAYQGISLGGQSFSSFQTRLKPDADDQMQSAFRCCSGNGLGNQQQQLLQLKGFS
jgi:ABC-type dipeptide/oligopeptide/nickel transport system permease component